MFKCICNMNVYVCLYALSIGIDCIFQGVIKSTLCHN